MSLPITVATQTHTGTGNFFDYTIPADTNKIHIQARTSADMRITGDGGTNYWTIKAANGPLVFESMAMGGYVISVSAANTVVAEYLTEQFV